MATPSDYEPSITPAEFVASWRQTLDLHPGVSLSKSSILKSPNISDMDNHPFEQDDWSHYGDESCAVTDPVSPRRAREDSYAIESRVSVEYLQNPTPYASNVLINTVFNDLDTRAKGIEDQFKRQQIWNKDIQWGINIFAEGLPRLQALKDTITALEAKLHILTKSRVGEVLEF
ncbi:hypothetical protein FE257_006684 [Aspergillus nanangensis]|uniref:Uncharacterized protein n=1 Tax=Aspergillus nanangensis TaxID=2582783 RepID=A0AAD4CNX2_ASPNN|nr:hypothetical protein FE257_006684 [Aspergillus nanangensis]